MPGPRAAQKLQMPRSSPGGAGRSWNWLMHYCHLEQTSLAMGRACFCFVYRNKNISFLLFWFMAYKTRIIIFEAPFKWFAAYRKRNVAFEARFLWFMAYRTRNATFEARLVWYMAYRTGNITFKARLFRYMAYRTRNIFTFEARFLWFMAYRTGSDTLEAHLFRFMHIERGILYFCTALVSLFSLNFRTRNITFQGSALVLVYGL